MCLGFGGFGCLVFVVFWVGCFCGGVLFVGLVLFVCLLFCVGVECWYFGGCFYGAASSCSQGMSLNLNHVAEFILCCPTL